MPSMTVTSADGTMLAVRRTAAVPRWCWCTARSEISTRSRSSKDCSPSDTPCGSTPVAGEEAAETDATTPSSGRSRTCQPSSTPPAATPTSSATLSVRSVVCSPPPGRRRCGHSCSTSRPCGPIASIRASGAADAESALDADDPDRALAICSPPSASSIRRRRSCERCSRCGREFARVSGCFPARGPGCARTRPSALAHDPPDIPTLYLYGEETNAPSFAELDEVAGLLPNARLHGLPGQRHLAFAFDPATFAETILAFTTTH